MILQYILLDWASSPYFKLVYQLIGLKGTSDPPCWELNLWSSPHIYPCLCLPNLNKWQTNPSSHLGQKLQSTMLPFSLFHNQYPTNSRDFTFQIHLWLMRMRSCHVAQGAVWRSVMTRMGWGEGREASVIMADLHCYLAETNTLDVHQQMNG